jgi:uncharacterized protein (DUF488 family)
MNIWEMGYRGVSRESLLEWLEAHPKAVLVDVRYGMIHPKNPWSQVSLRKVLGDRYRHFQSLGNVNYKSDTAPVELADQDKGLDALMKLASKGFEPVLMCACERYEQCHRSHVVEVLGERLRSKQKPGAVFERTSKPKAKRSKQLFDDAD